MEFKLSPYWQVKLLQPDELNNMSNEDVVTFYNLICDYIEDLNKYLFVRKDT